MANLRHGFGEVEGAGVLMAAAQITSTNGTLAIKALPPTFFASDISVYRLAAVGLYQVNIQNFRGAAGVVIPQVTVGSSRASGGGAGGGIHLVPLNVAVSSGSYTTGTDTYGFVVGIGSAGTFTDAEFSFTALAY